jgi:soluble P-type ATPase
VIRVVIPGGPNLDLEFLVLDFNGTVARDGILLPGVHGRLTALASDLLIHVLTADTFGTAKAHLEGIPCKVSVMAPANQDVEKVQYVQKLGANAAVCVGNGRNDRLMVREAALGIVVCQDEGAATETLMSGDLVVHDICAALDLLRHTDRLVATLRN